jgi:uncharacterized protein
VIYLDTSAILKLLRREAETDALIDHLDAHAQQDLITSTLATVETARALTALGATATAIDAVRGSDRMDLSDNAAIPAVAITGSVLDLTRSLPPAVLRSLDAIHIATAKLAGDELDHLITYDKRMIAAANEAGLRTASPV